MLSWRTIVTIYQETHVLHFLSSTNTHIPAPFWTAVVPVMVSFPSCNRAADLLIDWFGPEELKRVVGGERWWQVRGMDGIASEWITEGRFLDDAEVAGDGEKLSDDEETIKKMEKLETVMVRASEIWILISKISQTGGYYRHSSMFMEVSLC